MFTLSQVAVAIAGEKPGPGERLLPEITLFAVLINGRGSHEFTIELVRLFAADEEASIRETAPVTLDLGHDPTELLVQPFPIRRVRFPDPGVYQFKLRCGGAEVAAATIDVR
jgi:hypothetical protein